MNIKMLCEADSKIIANTNATDEIIKTGIRPYLSDDLPATNLINNDVTV